MDEMWCVPAPCCATGGTEVLDMGRMALDTRTRHSLGGRYRIWRERVKRLIAALSAIALVAALGAGTVMAHHAIPGDNVAPNSLSHWYIAGNPKCGYVADGGFNLKIDASDLHVGSYGPINITAYDGKHVSWEIDSAYLHTYDANMVIVKGGPT